MAMAACIRALAVASILLFAQGCSWTIRLSRTGLKNTVEIPAHTALEIGHLNNDHYENSRQQFINGRIFNLKKIQAGNSEVTRDNFDSYFKDRRYARVQELP